MSVSAHTKLEDPAVIGRDVAQLSDAIVYVRVSQNEYFAALLILSFAAAFLVYLELIVPAMIIFPVFSSMIFFLSFTDRVAFDGKRLWRTGHLPNWWATMLGTRSRLKLADIEQVETQALRALKRGRNVLYRYSTTVRGKGVSFTFSSGGEAYRRMTSALFSLIPENVLDNRSIEIRDHLCGPKDALTRAEFAGIPSVDVLETSLRRFKHSGRRKAGGDPGDLEQAEDLRSLANELRLSGFLLQAVEAFRRAAVLTPRNALLLLEYGRCLISLAGSEKNEELERRSMAMIRLAERHAGDDAELLARIGETFFQAGDLLRAARAFQRSISFAADNFRAVRGLAEIALREGKIAHVIHHYSSALRTIDSRALRRWSRVEAAYFGRLNDDDEYMEMEFSRVNLFDKLGTYQKTSLVTALLGFPVIIVGILNEEFFVANVGWAVSALALLVWVAITFARKVLSTRISPDSLSDESDQ